MNELEHGTIFEKGTPNPFGKYTSMATWENQLSFAAPCQCFTPTGIVTTSPARSSCASFPHSWYQPRPPVTSRIWPPPFSPWWMCQLFRQAGSKVTFATLTPFNCYRPLSPELTASSVLAWKKQQPFSLAATKFIEHMKYLLGITFCAHGFSFCKRIIWAH